MASMMGSNYLPTEYQSFSPMIIGSINIIVGILTTIQQYLKISELNEAHRVSSIAWDKFARNIKIELSKHPNERVEAKIFLKVCRQEFDRLMETSPDIRESVIQEFNTKFTKMFGGGKVSSDAIHLANAAPGETESEDEDVPDEEKSDKITLLAISSSSSIGVDCAGSP
mgnify:CR=1 FL=1